MNESGGKTDRGLLRIDVDECKGCGLCVEACPPKVIGMGERLESLRLSHGSVRGSGLHRVRNLLPGVS
jgi:2-oxoglutarate ferredoxin oxidoreductase subunit delta